MASVWLLKHPEYAIFATLFVYVFTYVPLIFIVELGKIFLLRRTLLLAVAFPVSFFHLKHIILFKLLLMNFVLDLFFLNFSNVNTTRLSSLGSLCGQVLVV